MLDPKHAAKMKVLEELRNMAHEMMGGDLNGKPEEDHMKQVSVAAPDEKSLKSGLDMASDMVDDDGGEDWDEDGLEDSMDGHEMKPEEEGPDAEELEKQIQELLAKKAALARK